MREPACSASSCVGFRMIVPTGAMTGPASPAASSPTATSPHVTPSLQGLSLTSKTACAKILTHVMAKMPWSKKIVTSLAMSSGKVMPLLMLLSVKNSYSCLGQCMGARCSPSTTAHTPAPSWTQGTETAAYCLAQSLVTQPHREPTLQLPLHQVRL